MLGKGGLAPPPQSKSRYEWGTGPPAAASTSRQVVSTDVSLSKESSDSAPSAPSTVNTNDHYNGKSSGESGCGKTSLRPDAAAAVPLLVPGRFGRGFGRAPHVAPTAGGIHHDCRTFGCFRQAAGPAAATAIGAVHCCVECFESEGGRHSRDCDGALEAPSGTQRPWAPGVPRDNAGRRIDVPRHMDESDDPSGMDEIDSLKQQKRPQQQQQQQQQRRRQRQQRQRQPSTPTTAPTVVPVVSNGDDVSAPSPPHLCRGGGCGRPARLQSRFRMSWCCDACEEDGSHDDGCTRSASANVEQVSGFGSQWRCGTSETFKGGSRGASSSGDGVGSNRAISPEMKEEVRAAIHELVSEKFALFGGSGDVDLLRVEELADLWVLFPLAPSDREVALRIAQI